MTHYRDGESLSTDSLATGGDERASVPPFKLRIGHAELGNWTRTRADGTEGEGFVLRNLNGRIDEFSIDNSALSAEEIADLYEIGKP